MASESDGLACQNGLFRCGFSRQTSKFAGIRLRYRARTEGGVGVSVDLFSTTSVQLKIANLSIAGLRSGLMPPTMLYGLDVEYMERE